DPHGERGDRLGAGVDVLGGVLDEAVGDVVPAAAVDVDGPHPEIAFDDPLAQGEQQQRVRHGGCTAGGGGSGGRGRRGGRGGFPGRGGSYRVGRGGPGGVGRAHGQNVPTSRTGSHPLPHLDTCRWVGARAQKGTGSGTGSVAGRPTG